MKTSIIESKNMIPWIVRQSRDVQAICKVLDLLINSFKTNVDYWISLIDFDNCPDHLLPLLASYVGYKYDYKESYATNRLIIKHYPEMIRNRGSKLGISLATALSVNTIGEIDKVEALSMFNIDFKDLETGIKIYVYFPVDLVKVRDLIEVVRPAGCALELIPADIISTIDGIQIHSYEHGTRYSYDLTRYSVGDTDKVGFAEVAKQKDIPNWSDYPLPDGGTLNK